MLKYEMCLLKSANILITYEVVMWLILSLCNNDDIDAMFFMVFFSKSAGTDASKELREVYDDYLGNVGGLEQHVLSKQRRERLTHRGATHSDEDDDATAMSMSFSRTWYPSYIKSDTWLVMLNLEYNYLYKPHPQVSLLAFLVINQAILKLPYTTSSRVDGCR